MTSDLKLSQFSKSKELFSRYLFDIMAAVNGGLLRRPTTEMGEALREAVKRNTSNKRFVCLLNTLTLISVKFTVPCKSGETFSVCGCVTCSSRLE